MIVTSTTFVSLPTLICDSVFSVFCCNTSKKTPFLQDFAQVVSHYSFIHNKKQERGDAWNKMRDENSSTHVQSKSQSRLDNNQPGGQKKRR
ncbi:hypothetical protein Mapa_012475 [Marchantia paleacea]|nr:hypothetical protein Mapa_012475 [Marchantia paleacea]